MEGDQVLGRRFRRALRFPPPILSPSFGQEQKTVAVLGIMGGGTSMVAAVLDALGVHMGPEEDLRQGGCWENFAMRSGDAEVRRAEVERCNRDYAVWGWKAVPGYLSLQGLPEEVRNLHAVFIYRDSLAVAMRWECLDPNLGETALEDLMEAVEGQYHELTSCLRTISVPRMVVSYHHALKHPELLVEGLCRFLDLQPDPSRWSEAIGRISPVGGYFYKRPPEKEQSGCASATS